MGHYQQSARALLQFRWLAPSVGLDDWLVLIRDVPVVLKGPCANVWLIDEAILRIPSGLTKYGCINKTSASDQDESLREGEGW